MADFLMLQLFSICVLTVQVISTLSPKRNNLDEFSEKIASFLNRVNSKYVVSLHENDSRVASLIKWPYIHFSSVRIKNSFNDNEHLILPCSLYDTIIIWIRYSHKRNAFLNYDANCPLKLKNKTLLYIVKNLEQIFLLSQDSNIQNSIFLEQNKIYFFEGSNNEYSTCKLFQLIYRRPFELELLLLGMRSSVMKVIKLPEKNFTVGMSSLLKKGNETKEMGLDLFSDYLCPLMNLKMNVSRLKNFEFLKHELQLGKIEASAVPFLMSATNTKKLLKMAIKIDYLGAAILQVSETNDFLWFTFLHPFSLFSWILIVMIMLTFAVILWYIHNVQIAFGHERLGSPRGLRFVQTLFTIFILLYYNAELYSSLAATPNKNPFQTLNDLLSDNRFNYHTLSSVGIRNMIEAAQFGDLLRLKKIMVKNSKESFVQSVDEAYKQICYPGFHAFIFYMDLFKEHLSTDCRFHLIKFPYPVRVHIAFTKRSRYVEIANQKLMWLKETGLLKRMTNLHTSQRICTHDLYVGKPISIYHTISAFVALLFGIATSLTILTTENLCKPKYFQNICTNK